MEFLRVLTYSKFKLSVSEQRDLAADYLPYCTVVKLSKKEPAENFGCRDPFDRPFLQLAVDGHADYLLTGDQDLLILNGTVACPVLTAEEFLKR